MVMFSDKEGVAVLSIEALDAAQLWYERHIGPDAKPDLSLLTGIIKTYVRVEKQNQTRDPIDYTYSFKERWGETKGGCDEPCAEFWFREGWEYCLKKRGTGGGKLYAYQQTIKQGGEDRHLIVLSPNSKSMLSDAVCIGYLTITEIEDEDRK